MYAVKLMKICLIPTVLAVCIIAASAKTMKDAKKTPARTEINPMHTWNPGDLYSHLKAWKKDLDILSTEIGRFKQCDGKLGTNPTKLATCLDDYYGMQKRYGRLSTYAALLNDQDTSDNTGQDLRGRIDKIGTSLSAATAFVRPQILAIPANKLSNFLKNKRLQTYRMAIDKIIRMKDHVQSMEIERLIAKSGDLANIPHSVYQALISLNIPYKTATLSNGQKVVINPAMFTRYRAYPDRTDRTNVFEAFFSTLKQYQETAASLLAGAVYRDRLYADARAYQSDLQAALFQDAVPTSIYTNMIDQVRKGLPLLWRYMEIRKRLMNLSKLGYQDLYAPIIPTIDMEFDWQNAKTILLASVEPMGDVYQNIIRTAFEKRWIDVYPTRAKRPGAYCTDSTFGAHPYVLINYNDDYDSLSTATHELGHAAHSYLSSQEQAFHNAAYSIFVAEVASTTNEHLLRLHLNSQETDPRKRLYLLGQYLERWRQTVFRQCQFAEFELGIHEMAQQGETLTAEKLNQTYLGLLHTYYGVKQGIMEVDPSYAVEWIYIPHFYYNFYVFQYTTSFIASSAIAKKIYAGDKSARDAYLDMLKAGGSEYPVELLRKGGADMTSSQPYDLAFESLEAALDEAESLIKQIGR